MEKSDMEFYFMLSVGTLYIVAQNDTCPYSDRITESEVYEPPHGKTNNVVTEQVLHKLTCTVTEKS